MRKGKQQLQDHLRFWRWLARLVLAPAPAKVKLVGRLYLAYGTPGERTTWLSPKLGEADLAIEVLG